MILLPDNSYEIKITEKKGRGFFTTKDITAGTVIGDYLGKVIRTAEEDTYDTGKDFYLMYYHDYASLHPDLTKSGIHLLNHSCTPNAWMYTHKGHVLFFALRHIFAGEELTIDYLLDPLDKTCNPCTHFCNCGSAICSGTMHLTKKRFTEWNTYYEKQAAMTKKQRVTYGKYLSKLESYPDNIPDDPIYTLFGTIEKPSHILSDTTVPDTRIIRRLFRETGRILTFSELHLQILGIRDNMLYAKTTS